MLGRSMLWISAVALLLTALLGALNVFGIGLSAQTPLPEDVSQRILMRFLRAEEQFFTWGQWTGLASGIGWAALLVAVVATVAQGGLRTILAAGAALAVAGEAMYLSVFAGMEVARVGLDNGLGETFAAGNASRYAMEHTSQFVWVSGLLVLAVGFFLVGRAAAGRPGRPLSWLVAIALAVAGVAHVIPGDATGIVFEVAFAVFALAYVGWVVSTSSRISNEAPQLAAS